MRKHGRCLLPDLRKRADGRRRNLMRADQLLHPDHIVPAAESEVRRAEGEIGEDDLYEDQGLEICASDQPEELIIVSKQQPFEIREAGLSRDQGISTKKAVIKQDVTYYIILESKHEISIKATKRC